MVPILIVRKTSNSSHQRLKLIRCAARQPARFATQIRAFGYQVIRARTRRLCTWSGGTPADPPAASGRNERRIGRGQLSARRSASPDRYRCNAIRHN
jgi:hypothetical protein